MSIFQLFDFSIRSFIAALLLLLSTTSASAQQVSDILSKITQPVAPRGGVLMLPLTAEQHGNNWPQSIELLATGGKTPVVLTGQIVWIHPAPPRAERHWTDDPRDLLVRAIQPEDDSRAVATDPIFGPYLLAHVPRELNGPLRLGKQTLLPDWRDVPSASAAEQALFDDRPVMVMAPSPDRPDPVSPFEYWRWVLLAERHEMTPPVPFGGEAERLTAEHYASLWLIGFDRLSKQSARIAQQCRNLLTQTCIDRRQPFAAWIADPVAIGSLLSILVDFRRNETTVLSDVVTWLDSQKTLTFWPEAEFGDTVRLAMFTSGTESIVATFRWLENEVQEAQPAMVVRIEPGVLMQVTLDRAPLPPSRIIGLPPPPEPEHQVLEIEAGGRRTELVFGQRVVEARPPGVFLRPLSPPLTLAEAQWRQQRIMPAERATLVQIRRLGGRWEIFAECRRPPIAHLHDGAAPPLPDRLSSFDDVRGHEAITILLGDESVIHPSAPAPFDEENAGASGSRFGPVVWLTIPENGFWKLMRGENDGTMQIHRRSYSDRWYCRIVLPEAWFSAAETHPAMVGLLRSHGDSAPLETGPNPSTPWRPWPSRAAINLEFWDDLPRED